MTDRAVFIYVDASPAPSLVGRLWGRARKNRQGATFEYDSAWLDNPERFALEPALAMGPGPFHTASDSALFGAIGDSAPDRWGRVLMRRAERRRLGAVVRLLVYQDPFHSRPVDRTRWRRAVQVDLVHEQHVVPEIGDERPLAILQADRRLPPLH